MTSRCPLALIGSLWISSLVGVGCGSRTGALDTPGGFVEVGGGSSGGSIGSGSGATSSSSGGQSDGAATCSAAGLPGVPEAYVFVRVDDFLSFFATEAIAVGSPLCAPGSTVASCAYDPRTPRTGPSDVHHSDALNRFVGPNGDDYIWAGVPDEDTWVVADEELRPAAYQVLLAYERCVAQAG